MTGFTVYEMYEMYGAYTWGAEQRVSVYEMYEMYGGKNRILQKEG